VASNSAVSAPVIPLSENGLPTVGGVEAYVQHRIAQARADQQKLIDDVIKPAVAPQITKQVPADAETLSGLTFHIEVELDVNDVLTTVGLELLQKELTGNGWDIPDGITADSGQVRFKLTKATAHPRTNYPSYAGVPSAPLERGSQIGGGIVPR
jgi:hypothetical protein